MSKQDSRAEKQLDDRVYAIPETIEKVGLFAGLLPFFVHLKFSSQSTVNGVVVDSSNLDIAALIGAGLALIAGLWSFTKINATEEVFRNRRRALCATLLLLAFVQGLSGFGKLDVDEKARATKGLDEESSSGLLVEAPVAPSAIGEAFSSL